MPVTIDPPVSESQAEELYNQLLEDMRGEFPGFRLVHKQNSRSQRAIHYALLLITAGRMRAYLHSYQTTIGQRVYVTADWDQLPAASRYITMRHERIHMRQFRRYTLLGMTIAYLLLPLPMGLAYARARMEWEAYAESIRAAASLYGRAHVSDDTFRRHIVSQFVGPSYGWMWPFRRQVESWYDSELNLLDCK